MGKNLQQSELLKDSEAEVVKNAPQNVAADNEASEDHNSESVMPNDMGIIKETSCITINKELQNKDSGLLSGKETEIINNIPSNIPIDKASQNNDYGLLGGKEIEIINNLPIYKPSQNNDSGLLGGKETEIINNIPSNIPIDKASQNNDSGLLGSKETEIINNILSNILIDKASQNNDSGLLGGKETEIIDNIPSNTLIDKAAQNKNSEPLKDNDIEIINEAPCKVVIERISIDVSSESSDDEFEKMIESAVQEAFVDNDFNSTKNKKEDKPKKNITEDTSKDYESVSSDDDEFEKMIENAVQEAFQDNDASSPKDNEKDKEVPQSDVPQEISQDQISDSFIKNVVEMSIDIPQNEEVNEVSRDDIVRPFAQKKKIKVECNSPEPDEPTVPIKKSADPPEEEKCEGEHAFSFTVSYYESKDPQNCAAYSEPKSRLYISKDFEFQVLCSAAGVPQKSVLRACVHFAAPDKADKVVKRCALHIRKDILSGKRNCEHVIQCSHNEAEYEKNKESGRFNVVIPYQCSQGPFQGCAELSCYTYKFVCWASCYKIMQRGFKVHFTLENNGVQLGKQVLDVKVCKCPAEEMEADSENSPVTNADSHAGGESPGSSNRIVKDFLIPALDSKKYGSLLHWGDEPGVFFIKWTHKATANWSTDEFAVFKDWDVFKGRPEPIDNFDIVISKQRMRAALSHNCLVENIDCYEKGYRMYKIKSINCIPHSKEAKKRTKNLDSPAGVRQSKRERRSKGKSQSKGERRTSRKVEPIAYEEATDDIISDGEEDCDNVSEPPAKKPKRLPGKAKVKKRKKTGFTMKKRRRPLSKSAKRIQSIPTAPKKSSPIVAKKSVAAKTRSKGDGQKRIKDGGFKKQNFLPKVELKKLSLRELLQAGVKMDVIEKYSGHNKDTKTKQNRAVAKIVLPPKSILRKQPNRSVDYPVNAIPPVQRNVFADQRMNFEATPYQIPGPTGQSQPLLAMPALNWKEEKPTKMLNTYSNIKTQGDMILAMIKAVLPSLPSDKVSEIYDYLVDMGVETADDLAYIEEDDLNKVLKPIQSRKLIAAWKNKGVPNHNASLPKRTCGAEPVTFVPAVFQIQNMASQNQISDTRRVFSAESESPLRSTVVNIPGWRQSTAAPSVKDVYPDLEYTALPKNDPSPPNKTPLPLPSSSEDWTDTFEIPWKDLPPAVMDCLLNRRRPNRNIRSTLINIVCKEIFKVIKYPLQSQIEVIAEKMWKRFPKSLCNEDCSYKNPKNEYVSLTKQMANRIRVLRHEDAKQPKLSEEEKRKKWLSQNYNTYGKKLDADLALPNSNSFASSVPSAASYSTPSSKPYTSSEPSFSYTPSTQSARSHTSLAPSALYNIMTQSVPYNSITPSAKSNISTTATDNSSMSSTLTATSSCSSNRDCATLGSDAGFVIPWHKLDTATLGSLNRRKVLSIVQRQNLVHMVCDEFDQWNQKTLDNLTEESRKLAKQMFLKYPASLSNTSLGHAGGEKSSSSLAKTLRSRIDRIKKRNKKLAEKSASPEQQVALSDSGDSVEGLLDWAVNFRIPWEKMPYALLECLRNKQRLTPALRQEMVRIITNDIQKIEENPSKECVDFIAKKMCKMYPKSLCDLCGDVVGNGSEFLGRQLLWRIQRVSYASKNRQGTLEHATADFDGLDITGSNNMDEFVNVNSMDNMDVVNVVPGVDDRSVVTYSNDIDTSSVMYPNHMNVNGYYNLSTDSYNGIVDYINTDYTSTLSGSGNNTTQCNYLNHLEQFIKMEVTEQDQRLAAKMFPGSEQRSDGEIL